VIWRLPVSGTDISLRQPDGGEDVLLYESADPGLRLALLLAGRLASSLDGRELQWDQATVTDLDAVMLFVRILEFGYEVRAEAICPTTGCRRRIDISFALDAYLKSNVPVTPRGVEGDGAGWYRLRDLPNRFRLPRATDLLAAAEYPDTARYLSRTCIEPPPESSARLAELERAMAAMAPNLGQDLSVVCPECAMPIAVRFDPIDFTLRELRGPASTVYQDVHLLASRYHWREAEILALPRQRRAAYADMAQMPVGLD
jgi:hypothetical protein